MKVKLVYCVEIEKELEMTPEEYCDARADYSIFPENAFNKKMIIADEQSKEELRKLVKGA